METANSQARPEGRIRLTLTVKLAMAFVFISFIGVIAMIVVLRVSTSRSFEDYIEEREMESLSGFRYRLADYYEEHDGWSELRGNRTLWDRMLNDEMSKYNAAFGRSGPGARRGPPGLDNPRPGAGRNRPGPPGGMDRRRGPNIDRLWLRLSLFDDKRTMVVGGDADPSAYSLGPIEVDGKTVGYLGIHLAPRIPSAMDQEFINRQFWVLYLTGAVIIGISFLIALLLARGLSAPVKDLARMADRVAERDFTARVELDTSDEIGRLARGLNQMAGKLGEYERRQHQWLSDIAHELRNPLAILLGEIEAIQDGVRTASPESLASLHQEASRLNKIVADLRVLSLADAGELPLSLQDVDPWQVLTTTLARLQPGLEADAITVKAEFPGPPVTISGDRDRLAQVFGNLLENVRKYAARPGTLEITGRVSDGRVLLSLDDSGPGVPAESLPRLFDRLYRVDKSRSRETGGSGLGLAIVKSIVESHHGSITARPSPRGGLGFDLEFPLS